MTAARGVSRPVLLGLLAVLLVALVLQLIARWPVWTGQTGDPHGIEWMPAFIAPLHPPLAGGLQDEPALRLADVTLRQFLPLALPARTLRVRLSNEFGEHPLEIGAASVGWRDGGSGPSAVAGSVQPLRFGPEPVVRVPPGATILSEPVTLSDGAGADLALSLYLPQATPRASWHAVGSRSSFRSRPGNHVEALEFPVASIGRDVRFVADVEAEVASDTRLWVAFGDSITAGAWHRIDVDASWPALWARAWRERAAGAAAPLVGVLNAGLGGDRLLEPALGTQSGAARFDRDVIARPGVRGVVLAHGLNDLGAGAPGRSRSEQLERLIAMQSALAERAHSRGLKVVGATLTPAGGSAYGRPEVEAARQQFNQWVRTAPVFDAVVDFDAAVRDPNDPQRMRPDWTTDWLHPDDPGYQAMAQAIVQALDRAGLAPV